MLNVLFGEIATGRLKRLPYLGWYALLALLVLLAGFGIGASFGLAERSAGGNIADAQALIADKFGILGIVLIVAVFAVLLFAQLNIAAKRIRDIGLPGWLVLLGLLVVAGLIGQFVSQQIAAVIELLFVVALLLLPSDALRKRGDGNPI